MLRLTLKNYVAVMSYQNPQHLFDGLIIEVANHKQKTIDKIQANIKLLADNLNIVTCLNCNKIL